MAARGSVNQLWGWMMKLRKMKLSHWVRVFLDSSSRTPILRNLDLISKNTPFLPCTQIKTLWEPPKGLGTQLQYHPKVLALIKEMESKKQFQDLKVIYKFLYNGNCKQQECKSLGDLSHIRYAKNWPLEDIFSVKGIYRYEISPPPSHASSASKASTSPKKTKT